MSSEKKQFLDYEDNIAGRGGNSDYCVDEKKKKIRNEHRISDIIS